MMQVWGSQKRYKDIRLRKYSAKLAWNAGAAKESKITPEWGGNLLRGSKTLQE